MSKAKRHDKEGETHLLVVASCSCGWTKSAEDSREGKAAASVHALLHRGAEILVDGWISTKVEAKPYKPPVVHDYRTARVA